MGLLHSRFVHPLFFQRKKLREGVRAVDTPWAIFFFSVLRLDLGKRLDSFRPASSPLEITGSDIKILELL